MISSTEATARVNGGIVMARKSRFLAYVKRTPKSMREPVKVPSSSSKTKKDK